MRAIFYNFSKRINSTKQPTGGAELDVILKQPTSIHTPTFRVKTSNFGYNYLYVPDFATYYWINENASVTNEVWEFTASVDVLATYKSAITSSSQYVMYDTTSNVNLIDTRLNQVTTCSVSEHATLLRDDLTKAGTFLLTCNGEDSGVGVYAVTRSLLNRIIPDISTVYDTWLQSEDPFGAIENGFMQLISSGSIGDNIKDVRWVPFAITGDTLVTPLKIGKYIIYSETEQALGARRIDTRLINKVAQINIPWQFNDWRNCEPYTNLTLYIPFVGVINLSASQLYSESYIQIISSLDAYTGDLAIMVVGSNDKVIGTYGASTGVSVFLGTTSYSPSNIIQGATQIATAAVANDLISAAQGATVAFRPMDSTIGGISSAAGAGLSFNAILTSYCHDTNVAPSSVSPIMGTPTYAYKSLSGLSGYVQCAGATVSVNAPLSELEQINSYLNSGIFIE